MHERTAHGGTFILGGGFAGSTVARLLGRRGKEKPEVVAGLELRDPLEPDHAHLGAHVSGGR